MSGDEKIDVIINDRLFDISTRIDSVVSDLNEIMSIPVRRIQSAMTKEGFMSYCRIRSRIIDLLPMLEILVDSAEGEVRCIVCGKPAEISTVDGKEILKGEVSHWIQDGRVIHDFTCDDCIRKARMM